MKEMKLSNRARKFSKIEGIQVPRVLGKYLLSPPSAQQHARKEPDHPEVICLSSIGAGL